VIRSYLKNFGPIEWQTNCSSEKQVSWFRRNSLGTYRDHLYGNSFHPHRKQL